MNDRIWPDSCSSLDNSIQGRLLVLAGFGRILAGFEIATNDPESCLYFRGRISELIRTFRTSSVSYFQTGDFRTEQAVLEDPTSFLHLVRI